MVYRLRLPPPPDHCGPPDWACNLTLVFSLNKCCNKKNGHIKNVVASVFIVLAFTAMINLNWVIIREIANDIILEARGIQLYKRLYLVARGSNSCCLFGDTSLKTCSYNFSLKTQRF